jgi:hypothetical protein
MQSDRDTIREIKRITETKEHRTNETEIKRLRKYE